MALLSDPWRSRLVVGLLVVLLFFSVFGANLALGAQRTVLNAEFVSDGLEDEGVYEELAPGLAESVEPRGATDALGSTFDGDGPDPAAMANSVVTPAWVKGEVERNLDSAYAFLHGDADELELAVDTGTIKAGFAEEFEAWILEADTAVISERMARLTESRDSFRQTRTEFEERQYQLIQQRTDEELSRSELETRYDENRETIRSAQVSELEDSFGESGAPPPIQEATVEYGTVAIDGVVAESMDYETLVAEEAQAREELAASVGDAVRARLDEEVPDSLDLTEDMDPQTLETAETARTSVFVFELIAFAQPLFLLAFAGLLGYVSQRRSNALWRVGGTVAAAGLIGAVLTWVAASWLPGVLSFEGETPAPAEAALSLATDAFMTVTVQSVLLAVVGLLLVAAGIGVRRELLPVVDDPGADADAE